MEEFNHIRHSLAHLLAAAVMELWSDAKRAIGPAIENGFYFDFEFAEPITDADLPKIEEKMRGILPAWDGFERHMLTKEDARKEYPDNPYKHELIDEFSKDGEELSFYKSGDYWDLCKGGHAESARMINPDAFKLTHIAGAYWRGNSKNPMLTRIYGLAFETKEELDRHLAMLEEAKKRDHKKLGIELDLFTFSDLVGPGLPLWTPKGTIIRNLLDDFVWELRKPRGFMKVEIPHITKKELYQQSGHWDKFSDELFRMTSREGHEFAMKPMNCPHHIEIYRRRPWSYRDLPQRYATTTTCYRDEQTGELSGLSRVRAFNQDDSHTFYRKSDIPKIMLENWEIVEQFYGAFGLSLQVRLSLSDPEHPEKYLGAPEMWQYAENQLRGIAKMKGADAVEAPGEAAFYGPKIDFMARDSLARTWQVATVQLDLNLPERFDLTCINEEGEKERIVMTHVAVMGSIERFLSIAIEHFAGAFPVWLAPVQARILPIADRHSDHADALKARLEEAGVRVETGLAHDTVGKRIRQGELDKIPYLLVIGDEEVKKGGINIRDRKGGQQFEKTDNFIARLAKQIAERRREGSV